MGAAFIRQEGLSNYKMTSLIHGGQQESGYRAGTHGVHNIVGFGKACEIAKRDMNEYIKKIPGVIGMLIPGIVNEMFIKNLGDKVALSAGSACGISEPSYVINEINKKNSSSQFIRLTLSKLNSSSDIKI